MRASTSWPGFEPANSVVEEVMSRRGRQSAMLAITYFGRSAGGGAGLRKLSSRARVSSTTADSTTIHNTARII